MIINPAELADRKTQMLAEGFLSANFCVLLRFLRELYLLDIVPNDEVSDATEDEQGYEAGNKKNPNRSDEDVQTG